MSSKYEGITMIVAGVTATLYLGTWTSKVQGVADVLNEWSPDPFKPRGMPHVDLPTAQQAASVFKGTIVTMLEIDPNVIV